MRRQHLTQSDRNPDLHLCVVAAELKRFLLPPPPCESITVHAIVHFSLRAKNDVAVCFLQLFFFFVPFSVWKRMFPGAALFDSFVNDDQY